MQRKGGGGRERENDHTFVLCDNTDAVSLMRGPDVTQGKFDSAYICKTVSVKENKLSVYVCLCTVEVCLFIFVRFRIAY